MREFKYRLYDIENNKMYYSNKDSNIFFEKFMYCSKDDIKLMQYTGLKDKHKIDIYEGDIVRVSEEYGGSSYIPLVVDFKDGCFVLRPINNMSAYNPIFEYDFYQIHEIIGNKFDNPELMEF